ncbi:MAG: transposase [Gammaproteobacteria bacterium]|nr:transposase [Gammaproteobacteria bacterium]
MYPESSSNCQAKSVSQFVDGMAHTNGIESFWSMLKKSHKGTFHKMSPKHLQRYVNELSGKHCIRSLVMLYQMRNTSSNGQPEPSSQKPCHLQQA